MSPKRNCEFIFFLISSLTLALGCASAERRADRSSAPLEAIAAPQVPSSSNEELKQLLSQLEKKVDLLATQIASMNDKMDLTRTSLEYLSNRNLTTRKPSSEEVKTVGVTPHPSEGAGTPVKAPPPTYSLEAGFVNDDATGQFRKAMIVFRAQKYPEAILAFSAFLEKYPDHPLAGSAQFYVGESYMKQKEYKLAIQEFQRVLTSYDRSSHISDTLSEMALAEDQLKIPNEASRHRQLLTSLFPQSPAASQFSSRTEGEPLEENPEKETSSKEIPPTAPWVETGKKTEHAL